MLLRAAAAALALAAFAAVSRTPGGAAVDPTGRHVTLLGRSADGRPIVAIETGDPDAPRRTLVVGCIHGNERAGVAIAEQLGHDPPPRELDLWIIPVLNPDGVAANTRGNGHGVDLNRNFPYRWRPLTGIYYSGPHPLSEPESRIAERLITRLNPQLSIWFHQHLDIVDQSGGDPAVERRFAVLTGMRLARLKREPGSVVGWENHREPAATAFVVELPAGSLQHAAVTRYAHAVTVLTEPPPRPDVH
jgi:murein peptide amidase A